MQIYRGISLESAGWEKGALYVFVRTEGGEAGGRY